jgi:hypothetical protein
VLWNPWHGLIVAPAKHPANGRSNTEKRWEILDFEFRI